MKILFLVFIGITQLIGADSVWVSVRSPFEISETDFSDRDTLKIVTCADYVHYPFGKLSSGEELKQLSFIPKVILSQKDIVQDNGTFRYHFIVAKQSKIVMFFDWDDESSTTSYVCKGEILDKEITLSQGIRIGMNIKEFMDIFFIKYSPSILFYKVVLFIPCVAGTEHRYIFDRGTLEKIVFIRPYSSWVF